MYEDKVFNEGQEDVVDSQPNEDVNVADVETEQPSVDIEDVEQHDYEEGEITENDSQLEEVAEPQSESKQSHQENAQYKKMRLKAKEEVERELAEQKKEIEAQRMALQQQLSERKILDEYLNPMKIYEYADEKGIGEDHARELLQFQAEKLINAEKLKVRESFEQQQTTKRKLAKDKYFKLLETEVDEIMRHNPDADYEAIYYYQRGVKAEELEEKYAKNVERRTVANMHDRARRKNVGGSSPTAPSNGMSEFGTEFASFMGVDPREAAKVVKERNRRRK